MSWGFILRTSALPFMDVAIFQRRGYRDGIPQGHQIRTAVVIVIETVVGGIPDAVRVFKEAPFGGGYGDLRAGSRESWPLRTPDPDDGA